MNQLLAVSPQGQSQVEEIFISYAEAQQLKEQLGRLSYSSDQQWLDARFWIAEQLKQILSERSLASLKAFGSNPQNCVLIVRGLPIDSQLPPTPYQGYLGPDHLPLVNSLYLGLYQIAGIEPIAYENENSGQLFRHVVPASHARNEKSSHGSQHTFGMHVDNPDLPLIPESVSAISGCPEYLSLLAVRCDLKVRSSIALLDSVLKKLNRATIEQLCQPQFLISRPDSFDNSNTTRLPVLLFAEDGTAYCRYDKENISPLTPEAAAALLMLDAELQKPENRIDTSFQPGDLMMLQNQRLLHSREGFQPREDGTDRWLVRLFGMKSLSRMMPVTESTRYIGRDSL